jgi:hypothetical protein
MLAALFFLVENGELKVENEGIPSGMHRSVARGKGAERPPPRVGMCEGKPARGTNGVHGDGGVPRGMNKENKTYKI